MNGAIMKTAGKIKLPSEIKMILFECFLFAAGFFLTPIRFIFGTYPFGLALVASCGKYTPFAFAGAILSVTFLMGADPVYLISFMALMGLRIVGSLFAGGTRLSRVTLGEEKKNNIISCLFCENMAVRVAVCVLCAVGTGVYRVIANGYVYYDIFVLFFFAVFCGVMTYCFGGAMGGAARGKSFILAVSSFSFCMVYALSGKEIQGIDIAIVFSYALTLYLAKYASGLQGAAVGTILGTVQNTVFAPVYAISGVVSGLLFSTSPYLAIMSAFALSVGYGIFVSGYEAIVYLVPELLGASLIMYPLLKFEMIPHPAFLKNDGRMVTAQAGSREIKDRISTLSSSFEEIAAMLSEVSEKVKNPSRSNIDNLCLEQCEKYCSSCPKNQICWEKDVPTTQDNISKMGGAVYENGSVCYSDIDEKFFHRCPNVDKIFDDINSQNIIVNAELLKDNKLEISAQDYLFAAKMLSCICGAVNTECKVNDRESETAYRACAAAGLVCDTLEVYGNDRYKIVATGVDAERSKCTEGEIKALLEKTLGAKLTPPVFDSENATLVCESARLYDIKSSVATSVTENESINGDSVCSFDGARDRFYMLVCDGMGSGGEAQLTSSICVTFLKKMLFATGEKEIALSMLNNFIRAKNIECSSSVDLMEADLVTGKVTFIKSGAAPSFIKRGDNVYKLASKTAPIGIMKSIDAESLGFEIRKGDIMVMVSDGVISSVEESTWLVEMLSHDVQNTDALPGKILKTAKEKNIRRDDMSVCVLEVI